MIFFSLNELGILICIVPGGTHGYFISSFQDLGSATASSQRESCIRNSAFRSSLKESPRN